MKKSELGDSPEEILSFIFNKLEELPKGSEDYEKTKNSLYGLIHWVKNILESKQYDLLFYPFFLIGIEYQALSNYDTIKKAKKYEIHKSNRSSGLNDFNKYRLLRISFGQELAFKEWQESPETKITKPSMAAIVAIRLKENIPRLKELRVTSKGGAELTEKEEKEIEDYEPNPETIEKWLKPITPPH